MHLGKINRVLLLTLFAFILSACGGSSGGPGGSDSTDDDTPGATPGDDNGGSDSGGDGGDDRSDISLKLGLITTDEQFVNQRLQIPDGVLVAGGEKIITVNVVDANQSDSLYANPVTIQFNSPCVNEGKAELSDEGTVIAKGGTVAITYKDLGCGVFGGKSDTVKAIITAIGDNSVSGSATASGTLTIAPPIVSDIEFVSATPESLRLNVGNAMGVTSQLKFKLVSEDDLPIVAQPVRFRMAAQFGNAALTVSESVTDANGVASVELQSGSVIGSVVVEAETDVLNEDGTMKDGVVINRNSPEIVIQSGLPTQDNFLLTVPTFNNRTYDGPGNKVTVVARMSDLWNRAVPDGTKVYFTSDKNGMIHGSPCTTSNGSCKVEWESARTFGYEDPEITIMAYALGEAIVHDTNSNKIWDLGEQYSQLSEPYLDADDNGEYNADRDTYQDINNDKKFTPAAELSQVYRGAACSEEARNETPIDGSSIKHCDEWATIWRTIKLINSSGQHTTIKVTQGGGDVNPGGTIGVPYETSIQIEIQDENGNIPPEGTTIKVEAANATVVSGGNISAVPNKFVTPGTGFVFTLGLRPDGTGSVGDLTITTTSLEGYETKQIYSIDDNDDSVITPINLGLVNLNVAETDLKPSQTTTVSVDIIDTANGNSTFTGSARVEFSSTCLALGKATFSKTTVDTTTGKATTSYTDQGCGTINGKTDTITATLIADGAPSLTFDMNVLPAQVGTLRSMGVSHSELALSAYATAAKPDSTEVLFKLEDEFGKAIADRQVDLSLTGNTGGAALAYTKAYTDDTGTVTARLQSGRLPGVVKVKATVKVLDDEGKEVGERDAFSEEISIFSRLPVAGNLILTASVLNPRAYDMPGEAVEIVVRAKDRNNLRVDDGTIIRFRTDDNGEIDEQCEIKGGDCKVTWRSARTSAGDYKISIMARTLGEVKFTDANNNNLYDDGEAFEALSEAYLDANDNGSYDPATDSLIDSNNDGELTAYDQSDSDTTDDFYRGVACSDTALAAGHCAELADVWSQLEILNSDGGQAGIKLYQDDVELPINTRITVTGTETFTVEVLDRNNNLPPKDTAVLVETNNGEIISGLTQFNIPNAYKEPSSGYRFSFSVKEDGTPSDGQLVIQVTSLDGAITRYSYTLNDGVDTPDEVVEIAVGKLDAGVFEPNVATLAIGNGATMSSNGSTTVTADIVNREDSDARYNKLTHVIFKSLCAQRGKAEFSPATAEVIGVATSTYKDLGCAQDTGSMVEDDIQVIVVSKDSDGNINEVVSTATATVTIAPPEVGSIEFVSAEPQSISLKGLGNSAVLPENSRVTFKVLDESGAPMAGKTVQFSLSRELSGAKLPLTSVASGSDGLATVQLLSGNSHGSVSIKAELVDEGISTNSAPITITTGLPTQKSMTLSLDKNNVWGWDYSGETVTVTARVADQYGNWVPDGTSIVFAAEGGSIDDECTTTDGKCDVVWTGQNPRPIDGIATIIARMEGVAYFQDLNDNGWFDEGEVYDTFGEAYLDADDSGTYNPGADYQSVVDIDGVAPAEFGWDPSALNERERPFDFNNNGTLDPKTTGADKRYQGVACTPSAKAAGHCAARFEVHAEARIIMGDGTDPLIEGPFLWDADLNRFDTTKTDTCIDVSYGSKAVGWRIADSIERRNKLPGGSQINLVGDQTKLITESGTGAVSSFTDVPVAPQLGDAEYKYNYLNERGHLVWANIIRADDIDSETGSLSLEVATRSDETFQSMITTGVAGDNAPIYEDDVLVTSLDVSEETTPLEVTLKLSDGCFRQFDAGTQFMIRTENGVLGVASGETQASYQSDERLNVTVDGTVDANGYNVVRFTVAKDAESSTRSNALVIYGPNGKIADYQIAD